jgi:hypothetical protein
MKPRRALTNLRFGEQEIEMTLSEFADWIEQQKPSPAQMDISSEYNRAVLRTLEWVAEQARKQAVKREPNHQQTAINALKQYAVWLNVEHGDQQELSAAIAALDLIWDDHAAAHRFYTMLEQTAITP